MDNTADTYERAKALIPQFNDRFLELAPLLRDLSKEDQSEFRRLLKASKLGLRKAYYLIEIQDAFEALPATRERLYEIGWTKLSMLAKHITKANCEQLLQLAEENKARDLQMILRGEDPPSETHCLLMYLDPQQFDRFAAVASRFGAQRAGKTIHRKEAALMAMVAKLEADDHRTT